LVFVAVFVECRATHVVLFFFKEKVGFLDNFEASAK